MKTAIAIAILGAFAAITMMSPSVSEGSDIQTAFSDYCQDFGKNYDNAAEFNLRLSIFTENMSQNGVINQFSDWTQEEFESMLTLRSDAPEQPATSGVSMKDVKPIDWTPITHAVKDQKSCGSCWAFAASAGAESLLAINYPDFDIDAGLSEQQQMDCSYSSGNLGCLGGLMKNTWNYFIKSGDQWCNDASYPYEEKNKYSSCESSKCTGPTVTSYDSFTDCDSIIKALEDGPVTSGVAATTWKNYNGDESNPHDCQGDVGLNHGIEIVGVNANGDWKIKNSWGVRFGNDGFMWIKAGNQCGICQDADQAHFEF